MEITGWTIYWITRLEGISALCGTLALISGLGMLAFFGAWAFQVNDCIEYPSLMRGKEAHHEKSMSVLLRVGRWLLCTSVAMAVISVFTPTSKQAAAILVIPALANNEDVQGLGEDFVGLAREWMQELRPKTEEK